MVRGGFWLLWTAIRVIIVALGRCVRFAVAATLCLLGRVGSLCGSLGIRVAHPSDRKLLKRLLFDASWHL
jgi:hypothetical protein